MNNALQIFQTILFNHPYTRQKLNILPHLVPKGQPPPPPPRPGVAGFILDQRDMAMECFKSWEEQIKGRREEMKAAAVIASRNEAIDWGRYSKQQQQQKGKAEGGTIAKEKLK